MQMPIPLRQILAQVGIDTIESPTPDAKEGTI